MFSRSTYEVQDEHGQVLRFGEIYVSYPLREFYFGYTKLLRKPITERSITKAIETASSPGVQNYVQLSIIKLRPTSTSRGYKLTLSQILSTRLPSRFQLRYEKEKTDQKSPLIRMYLFEGSQAD